MTPKQIVDASRGARELTALVLPFKKARALAGLKKALRETIDVIAGSERALAESLGGVRQRSGEYKFPDAEARDAFLEANRALYEEDDETLTLPTVDLSGQTDQLKISADAIAALEGIVIFERGDRGEKS